MDTCNKFFKVKIPPFKKYNVMVINLLLLLCLPGIINWRVVS